MDAFGGIFVRLTLVIQNIHVKLLGKLAGRFHAEIALRHFVDLEIIGFDFCTCAIFRIAGRVRKERKYPTRF